MPPSNAGADFDGLVGVIKALQERIRADDIIGRNETRTRDALINPLLKALGWETTVVVPEYQTRHGIADYALLQSPTAVGRPIALVEAKRMNDDLNDEHRNQVFDYARDRKSVEYVGLTNGDRWEFYEVFDRAPANRILQVSIRRQSAAHCAAELQPLKRSNLVPNADEAPRRPPTSHSSPTQERHAVPWGPPRERPDTTPYVATMLSWLAVGAFVGVIVGGVFGFRAAAPVLEYLVGPIGAIVAVGVVIAASVFLLRRVPWNGLWNSLRPRNSRTLAWSSGALAGGSLIGGLLGYIVALEVAQPFFDLLAGVGTIVLVAAAAAGIALVVWLMATSDNRRRRFPYRGRRWPRR